MGETRSSQEEPRLAHCARCRRLYVRTKSHVCDKCFDMEESDFARIRDEIAKDPNLIADEVAERANVTVACVFRMLDEGLIASACEANDVTCGRCGLPAIGPRQRLCTACLYDLDRQLTIELNQVRLLKKAQEMKGAAQFVHETLDAKRRL